MATLLFITELTMYRSGANYSDDGDAAERCWRLVFDGVPADHDEIAEQEGLPSKGDLYKPDDPFNRRLSNKTVNELDSGLGYVVVGRYERKSPDVTYNPSPLDRKDDVSGDFSAEKQPFDVGSDGLMIVTTAGYPFSPPLTRYAGVFQFKVTGNRATTADAEAWAGYMYPACAYNNASVTIRGRTFGAKKLLMMGMTFDRVEEGNDVYDRWTWTLGVYPAGWDTAVKAISRGLWDANGRIIKGDPPAPVTEPWPLDELGVATDSADDEGALVVAPAYYAKDFGVFGWTTAA